MTFKDKLDAAQKELVESDIRKSNYNPPVFVLLRKLGFNTRPFHYNSFIANFLIMSIWFGFGWGVIMWFVSWESQGLSFLVAVILSVFAGFFFGLCMALYYRNSSKKNNLSQWQAL